MKTVLTQWRQMNEALPREGDTLRVSDDKAFCMEQMRSSMKKNLDEAAWPTVQYLWKLHPILSWVNDKSSLLFKRDQAPVIGVPQKLTAGECIYIVTPDEIFDSYKKYCNEHETWWSETGLSDDRCTNNHAEIRNRMIVTYQDVHNNKERILSLIEDFLSQSIAPVSKQC